MRQVRSSLFDKTLFYLLGTIFKHYKFLAISNNRSFSYLLLQGSKHYLVFTLTNGNTSQMEFSHSGLNEEPVKT